VSFSGKYRTAKVARTLDSAKAGSILFFPGHVMLYLGKVGNKHYIIHGTFKYMKNNGHGIYEIFNPGQVVISKLEDSKKTSGVTFMNSINSITTLE
jgi:hypothetical protein